MGKRGQNEGSVYKRKDGRWAGSITLGYRTGKRVRKHFYGATQKEVNGKLTKAKRDVQQGLPLPAEKQTVGGFLLQWLEDTARLRVKPRTFVGYEHHVKKHIDPELGKLKLHDLSPQQVQRFLNEKAKNLAPRTVARIRATLRTALSQAEKWNLVARNVAKLVDLPKPKRGKIRFLDPSEAQALLSATEGFRLGPVFSVAMAVGLRLGEALGLRWEDVDLERKVLRVEQTLQRLPKAQGEEHGRVAFGPPKSETSRRSVSLPDFAVLTLQRHRTRQKEERLKAGGDWQNLNLVFTSTIGTPVDERNLRREFKEILKAAKLPHMRIHDLRHTCASLLLAQGVQAKVVQEILGHSQITLTLDTYSHLIPGLQQDAAQKMNAILAPSTTQEDPVAVSVAVNQA